MIAFFATFLATVIVSYAHERMDNPCKGFDAKYAPDLSDCTKFYFCSNGKPELGSCDPGKVFDVHTQNCWNEARRDEVCITCPKRGYSKMSMPFACTQ